MSRSCAEAVRRADESRAITTFFTTLLDQATEPGYSKGQSVTVDDLMAKAEEMLATGSFDDKPLVEAELRIRSGGSISGCTGTNARSPT